MQSKILKGGYRCDPWGPCTAEQAVPFPVWSHLSCPVLSGHRPCLRSFYYIFTKLQILHANKILGSTTYNITTYAWIQSNRKQLFPKHGSNVTAFDGQVPIGVPWVTQGEEPGPGLLRSLSREPNTMEDNPHGVSLVRTGACGICRKPRLQGVGLCSLQRSDFHILPFCHT